MADGTCVARECDRPVYAREVCTMHYQRLLAHGSTDLPCRRKPSSPEWLSTVEVPVGTKALPVVISPGEFTYTIVDAEDYDGLSLWRWRFRNGYAGRSLWNGGQGASLYMHRVIMDTPPGMEADHINRNKLDNRRSNLRNVGRSTNAFNTSPGSLNTSGYKGVSFYNQTKRWRAYITYMGKRVDLGYFSSMSEAIAARQAAEIHYLGALVTDHLIPREANLALTTMRRASF